MSKIPLFMLLMVTWYMNGSSARADNAQAKPTAAKVEPKKRAAGGATLKFATISRAEDGTCTVEQEEDFFNSTTSNASGTCLVNFAAQTSRPRCYATSTSRSPHFVSVTKEDVSQIRIEGWTGQPPAADNTLIVNLLCIFGGRARVTKMVGQ
jgi:hypothetical protein